MAQCRSASPERASAPLHEIYGNEPLEPSAVDSTGAMDGPIDFPQTVEVFSHSLTLTEKVKGQSPTAPELVVLFFHLRYVQFSYLLMYAAGDDDATTGGTGRPHLSMLPTMPSAGRILSVPLTAPCGDRGAQNCR